MENNGKIYTSIGDIVNDARNIVFNILIDEHKYNEQEAELVEQKIHESTMGTLCEKFQQKDLFIDTGGEKKHEGGCKEIANWYMIATSVPFYHSLGDTIGYYNGNWEFNYGEPKADPEFTNELIYDFINMGGINEINITHWLASDDTILYLDTLEVIVNDFKDIKDFGNKLKKAYIQSLPLIEGRHPGDTTVNSLNEQKHISWDKLPYNTNSKGAGAAMRSGCIGIFYLGVRNREKLITLSIECARITHNSAIGILSSVTAALFTAFALEKVSILKWPSELLEIIDSGIIDKYIKETRPKEYSSFNTDKNIFIGKWKTYINSLLPDNNVKTNFKLMKNPVQRYKFLAEQFSKGRDIPGSCGDDALIMAYDSVVRSNGIFEKLVVYAILHPGDSDTVGAIACGWFGGYYHTSYYERLYGHYFEVLEFKMRIRDLLVQGTGKLYEVFYHELYLTYAHEHILRLVVRKSNR